MDENMLFNVINSLPYGIFWKNEELVYLGCNQKFLYLVGKQAITDIIGKTDIDIGWGTGRAGQLSTSDQQVINGKRPINVEQVVTLPKGPQVVVKINKVPLLEQDGRCVGLLGIVTQVAEQIAGYNASSTIKPELGTKANAEKLVFAKTTHPVVLLVEDNDIASNISQIILKQFGCEVKTTANAKEALVWATQGNADLMITDIGLPNMSGTELTMLIRAWEQSSHSRRLPIIGLTALAMDNMKKECLDSGMDTVVRKPLTHEITKEILSLYLQAQSSNSAKEKTALEGMPEDDKKWFQLANYPVFDMAMGLRNLGGNKRILSDALKMLVEESIPYEMQNLQKAHAENDWGRIQAIVLKLNGGALYCGAVKMTHACQCFEDYWISGQRQLLEKIYIQLIAVLIETQKTIKSVLEPQKM
jgi:CheY-like chemotaxis protein